MTGLRRWPTTSVIGVVALTLAYVALVRVLATRGLSSTDDVSNWGQWAASTAAAAGCWVASRHSSGDERRAWLFIGAGVASWSVGQLVWTYYESVRHQPAPFPSAADAGYLLFPLVTGLGLVAWMGWSDRRAARGRDVFDGLIIAGSLLVLSWLTVLQPVATATRPDGWLSLVLSLAYPVGDLVLGTLVLLALVHAEPSHRRPLWTIAAGLAFICVADTAFMVTTANGSFSSADVVSSGGWFAGFMTVAAAGFGVPAATSRAPAASPGRGRAGRDDAAVRLALPYLALVVGLGALGVRLVARTETPTVPILVGGALVAMVLIRQLLAMVDNQRLIAELAAVHRHLEHEATHDTLTGLANRALLMTELDRALAVPNCRIDLLFCDLDGFKVINDDHGHDAGDEVLRLLAGRLAGRVASSGTVARIGGDEFVVLLVDSTDPDGVIAAASGAVDLSGCAASAAGHLSVSVGRASHRTGASTEDTSVDGRRELARSLLRTADADMYAAKARSRGRRRGARAHVA